MIKEFGVTVLELSKDDIRSNPKFPVLRMYDGDELIGRFDIRTGEILEDIDLDEYDIEFAQNQLEMNRGNYLETWGDYVRFLHA